MCRNMCIFKALLNSPNNTRNMYLTVLITYDYGHIACTMQRRTILDYTQDRGAQIHRNLHTRIYTSLVQTPIEKTKQIINDLDDSIIYKDQNVKAGMSHWHSIFSVNICQQYLHLCH